MDKYTQLHPQLKVKVGKVMAAMAALGFPMAITDGVRTTDQQQELYAEGRTKPGPNATSSNPLGDTVTNCDGVINKSNHQLHNDGYGHAVDCAFMVNGIPSWDDHLPWPTYGYCAIALGLMWGGNWKSRVDRPHIELP